MCQYQYRPQQLLVVPVLQGLYAAPRVHLHREGQLPPDQEPLPDAVDALEVALLQEDVVLPRQSLLGRNNIKSFLR